MSEYRLGDIIDDYCTKCRLLTNHAIAALVNEEPAMVRCRTCYFEHKYRHGKGGAVKKKSKKQELFDQVLAKMDVELDLPERAPAKKKSSKS
ncbi:MAG: hypothetical protein GC160_18975 [Acidobacteria bacterium]|nr:hypothetical protein [Acidobacteriota bacterium]